MRKLLAFLLVSFSFGLKAQSNSKAIDRLNMNLHNRGKDSTIFEYVRVTYVGSKFTAYYEDGRVEDLKSALSLNTHGIVTDLKLANIFFAIAKYMRTKGFYLVTSYGGYSPSSAGDSPQYCEYIYRRDRVK